MVEVPVTGDVDIDKIDAKPLRVCIYTAVTGQDQFSAANYGWRARFKSVLKNALNDLATRLTGNLHLEEYAYKVANGLGDYSNRGDIGIRQAIRKQLAVAFSPRAIEFIEVGWGQLSQAGATEIGRACDLFVVAGGGYVFINGDGSGGARFSDVPFLKQLSCPVVALGIGLNRLMHEDVCSIDQVLPETKRQVAALTEACASVAVRDRDTFDLFKLYGKYPPVLIGDPALFLRSDVPVPRRRDERLRIGVNFAAHGWRALSTLKPLLPQLVSFLKSVQSRLDADFVYLMHHDFERPVFAYLQHKGLRIKVVDGTTDELLATYASLDFVINQMLHSCIFAANQDVPFLNIAYDRKSLAFCDLLGIPECAIAHTGMELSSLSERFDELFDRRTALVATMRKAKESLSVAQDDFLRNLANSIPVARMPDEI